MNDSSTKNMLEVRNFGPIASANIDLRPLTVFVGPSNTGKSWLAILIYALHRHFGRVRDSMMLWHPRDQDTSKIIEPLTEWAKQTFVGDRNPAGGNIVLPNLVVDEIHKIFDRRGGRLSKDILRCFGMDKTSSLIRKASRDSAYVDFERRSATDSMCFAHELTIKAQSCPVKVIIPQGLQIHFQKEDRETDISYLRSMAEDMISLAGQEEQYHLLRRFMNVLIDLAVSSTRRPSSFSCILSSC